VAAALLDFANRLPAPLVAEEHHAVGDVFLAVPAQTAEGAADPREDLRRLQAPLGRLDAAPPGRRCWHVSLPVPCRPFLGEVDHNPHTYRKMTRLPCLYSITFCARWFSTRRG